VRTWVTGKKRERRESYTSRKHVRIGFERSQRESEGEKRVGSESVGQSQTYIGGGWSRQKGNRPDKSGEGVSAACIEGWEQDVRV